MAQKPIAKTVEEFLNPIVEGLGYEIVEVEYAKKSNGMNLTIFIDTPNGIKIEDCEKVHSAIDEPLDELDPTDGKPYTLNVSSPGIDRPIVSDKDYNRNLGEILEVKLFQSIDKKKIFIGKLLSFDETSIELETEKETIKLERKMISKATKYIEI